MTDIILVCIIIVITFMLFASDKFRIDFVAILLMATLMVIGQFRPNFANYKEAISGFSNTATVTIAAMFVLSAGLIKTGAIDLLSHRLFRLAKGSERRLFIIVLLTAGFVSAFINNTAAVAVFMPILITVCRTYKISPSKMLIPLSYVTIVGGTCTLIGTSTNILVSSMSAEHGFQPFGMFELTKLGIIFFGFGMLYLYFVARQILPTRMALSTLTRKYRMSHYLTALVVNNNSPLIGRTPGECRINSQYDVMIIEIIRDDRRIWSGIRDTSLHPGDVLLVRGSVDGFMAMKNAEGITIRSQDKFADEDLATEETLLAEGILAPTSALVGKTLKEADFRRKYGVFALAIRKHGETIHDKIGHIKLESGDTLLLQGRRESMAKLADDPHFILVQEVDYPHVRSEKVTMAVAIIAGVVLLAALGITPIVVSATVGCVLMVLSGCIKIQEAYESIDWLVIFLLAGVIPLGIVMEKTGTAQFIAGILLNMIEDLSPTLIISAFYLLTTLFTSFMSNNAAAVVMIPIGLASASELGLLPMPFLMAITFGASSSLSTPFGYHTNLMVYGPGGYKFFDYIKTGVPLNLMLWLLATIFIPLIWPPL
ncbi:SLC13 family permease [candidate division KSB1 bacterium]|nr:SLC13 family permease [candidate division KSB1 bacterium]